MRRLSSVFALVCCALVMFACTRTPRVVNPSAIPSPANSLTTPDAGDYSPRITNLALWNALAASPGRQMVARTEVVKVIIDLADGWKVYFLQSRRWEIHYYFAARFLASFAHPVEDHGAFNVREYRRDDRRFILGTLTRYRDQDVWAYELIAADTLDLARTAQAFRTVRDAVFFGAQLRYRPVPPTHEARVEEIRAAGVPVVTTQDIFGSTRYQPLNPGEAWGYLRFIHGDPDPSRVRRTDIVVLDTVPLDLPVCAGVITNELQAPLGHLAVLATNRATPDMALRGAHTDASLRALEGRLVRLRVTPQDWSVTPATQQEAERAWESRRPRGITQPSLSLRDAGLPDIRNVRRGDVGLVGAKAAQMGELTAVGHGVNVPRAFAIPFYHYHELVTRNGVSEMIRAAMAHEDFQNDPAVREDQLRRVRERIEGAPVPPSLIAAVRARVRELFPGARVRLRSSTNAEDLPGFNGAGLYRSVVIDANADDRALEAALRAVWSSVWSFQAFEERAYFRIDQTRVAMAVLVQESIDDEVVNGVAITANPFNEGRPGLFINAQVAGAEGGSVTSARGDEVPEQVVYYTYGEEREFERLSRSSRAPNGQVLTDDEVFALSQALRAIHRHFNSGVGWSDGTPMDVEFILAGPARRVVIVQARPYPVRWDHDRGVAMPLEE
jgi:hypothetical protein